MKIKENVKNKRESKLRAMKEKAKVALKKLVIPDPAPYIEERLLSNFIDAHLERRRLNRILVATDLPISGLPDATLPLDGTELVPLDQGGTTVQTEVSNLPTGEGDGDASSLLSIPITYVDGGPNDGDVLTYISDDGSWENIPSSSGGVEIDNTDDPDSFYFLTNPGSTSPFQMLGLNTTTEDFISFTSDENNINVNFNSDSLSSFTSKYAVAFNTVTFAASHSASQLVGAVIAADTLIADGQEVVLQTWGTFTVTAPSLTLNFLFGGITVFTPGSAVLNAATPASYKILFTVKRTSSSTITAVAEIYANFSTLGITTIIGTYSGDGGTGFDFTADNALSIIASTGPAGTITAYGYDVYLQ